MKHTVKRLLSLLLVLIFSLGLYPAAALAEPEGNIAPVEDSAEPGEDCVLDVPSDGSGSISMVPPPAEQQDTLPSGTCGDRLSWIFDEDSGVLTISGDGAMEDYTWSTSGTTAPWYPYRAQIVEVVLPDGITSVGNNAFRNCSALTRINLPEGITSIGASSFAFCRQLSAVSIPGSAESLGGSAFYECSGLTSVELRPGLAEIGGSAFHKCTALTEISLPASVMRIQTKAFNGCSALTQISFLGHAPTIAGDAFTGVSAVARYPGASGSWNSDTLQNYGGTLSWEPYYEKYELYILGTQLDESHLSDLLDNTLAYSYDPGENVLSLQGSYTVTAEDPDPLIRSGIEGLTIRIDSDTRLYLDERDEDYSFLALAKDATITGDGQLQLYGGSGSGQFTGVSVGDGAELTLLDANLYCSGLTYGLRGDPDGESALYFVRATATLNGSWGGVRWFSGGISLRNSAIVEPEAYRVSDDGSILRGTGSTPASTVRVEPRYDLVIDGTPVTDQNRADVLSNGVFSFDGDHTLTVSGNYTGTADVLIDSNLYSLVVNVPGTAVLTNSSSASETALIRSSGDLFLSGGGYLSLKHAENAGDDSCGVLLIGANEATLSVQQCMLNVSNVARGFATSNVGQSLRLYKAEVKISSFDTAVSGFTGGVTLTDCAYVTPAYAGEKNGTVIIDSIWGDAPCANLEITGKTVYDLIVDNTRVYADNLDDIRGAGVFSFDPGTNTLHVSGVYDPETIWSGWAINKFRPVIDSSIDGLIIRVDGDTVLTSYLENYNSYTPVINSLGALTICAEGETMPVLTLAHKDDSIPFDGIHTAGALTLQNVDLQIDHCGRGLVGDGTAASSLTFDAACASIMATDGAEDAAVITGFPGGISLQNGSIYFYPGFSVVNGTLYQYGEISLGVRISTGGYNLFVDGYQISNERLYMNFGTIVYDPEANVLYLNGSGEAPVACDRLPYIENHIPGLTIHVVNAIKLPTATEATGRGIIETDVDMTIRSNNCYLALEGNGSGATGIMVKNGAKLTLDGARINILNVGYGVRGEGGAKLEVVQSWVHANDTASAGLYGFSGGLTLRETDLHTPSGGVIKSGSVFEPDGTTLAKSVELFGAVYELNIDGHWVTYENRADILGDGTFSYDPDTNTLTVSKSYSSASSATMISNQIDGLTIAVSGDVTLTNSYDDIITYVIYSTADLTVTGGNLTLKGNGLSESYGIRLSGDDTNLALKDSNVVIEDVAYGLAGRTTGQKLTVNNATVKVTAAEEGVSRFDGGIELTGTAVSKPENYTVNSNGTICDSSGNSAGYVEIAEPFTAYQLWICGTQVTSSNRADILGDGTVSYDPSAKVLALNNAELSSEKVYYSNYGNYIIYANGDLTITGTGSIAFPTFTDYTHSAIRATGSITLDGDIDISMKKYMSGIVYWAVFAVDDITVAGGNITIKADGCTGLKTDTVNITGGTLNIECGSVVINSSTQMGIGVETRDLNISGGKATFNCGAYGMIVRTAFNMTGGELNIEKGGLTSYGADVTFSSGTATLSGLYSNSGTWMLTVENDARLSVNSTVKVPGGIVIGDGLAITTPDGGKIVQITPESGDPYYTVTESDGATAASHVVIEPLVAYPLWLGETQVTTRNKDDILGDGTASYDPSTKTLTLNNFTGVQGTHNDALIFAEIDMLTLNLVGTNTLSGSADLSTNYTLSGIDAGGKTLIIAGEGSLLIDIATGSGAAIGACDHLIMESGSLCAYAKQEPDQAFAIYGVTVKNLTINGGVLDIYGTYACMPYRSSDHFAIADDYVIMAGYRTDGKDVSACTLPEFLNLLANYPRYNYVHFAPLTAYDLWLGETQVTTLNKDDILGDGTASFDPATNTLTFTTAMPNITGLHEGALIYANGVDLTMTGNAELNNESANYGIYLYSGSLTIRNAQLTIKNVAYCGIEKNTGDGGAVTITNSEVTVEAGKDHAIYSIEDISITDSTVTCSTSTSGMGLYALGSLNLSDSTISVDAKGNWGIYAGAGIDISGGKINSQTDTGYALCSKSGITYPTETHRITLPENGKFSQVTDGEGESATTYYTITESDGTTAASHVVIERIGDINRDGEVNALDLMLLRKYLVELPIEGTFDEAAADLNGDNVIDILDLVRLRKVLA